MRYGISKTLQMEGGSKVDLFYSHDLILNTQIVYFYKVLACAFVLCVFIQYLICIYTGHILSARECM